VRAPVETIDPALSDDRRFPIDGLAHLGGTESLFRDARVPTASWNRKGDRYRRSLSEIRMRRADDLTCSHHHAVTFIEARPQRVVRAKAIPIMCWYVDTGVEANAGDSSQNPIHSETARLALQGAGFSFRCK